MTAALQQTSVSEKIKLAKALGITPETLKSWRTSLNLHESDIIEGKIFPNINVTTKGISPMEMVATVANVELARIRGQLKRVSLSDLNI